VRNRHVRQWLERAIELRGTDEVQALGACVVAYRNAMVEYRRDRWGQPPTPLQRATPFEMKPGTLALDSESFPAADDIEYWANDVNEALDDVGTSLEALAVGLDLDRLEQLRQYWPHVLRVREGGVVDLYPRKPRESPTQPADVVKASIDFVTNAALQLQERVRPL
jgi:hypothetical protein